MAVTYTIPSTVEARILTTGNPSLTSIRELINTDRLVYATMFPYIASELRNQADDSADQSNARPYTNDLFGETGTRTPIFVCGFKPFWVPDVLPGTPNRSVQVSTPSLDNWGGIYCESFGSECDVFFGIRKITNQDDILDGTTNDPTYSNWRWAQSTHTSTSNQTWVAAGQITDAPTGVESLVLPSGTQPGDLLECAVAFRQRVGSTDIAFLNGYGMYWLPLTSVEPQ